MKSLVRYAIENGGDDFQIMFPQSLLCGKYSAGNPTCAVVGDDIVYNTRLVSYRKILQSEDADFIGTGRNQTYFLHKDGFDSRNAAFRIDGNKLSWIHETDYGTGDMNAYYRGFEDCRFVVWDGVLYSYGTRLDKTEGVASICLYRLDGGFNVVKETVVKNPFGSNCEKNWVAIEGMPFCFIYLYNPMTVVKITDLDTGDCEEVLSCPIDPSLPSGYGLKGSTQAVSIGGDMFLSVAHMTDFYDTGCMEKVFYRSVFVLMDESLTIKKISEPFVFRTDLCEFTCGITVRDGFVWIPYSQVDCTVNVLKIPVCALMYFIDGVEGLFPVYGFDYIYGIARKYYLAEQFGTSSVMYNYAAVLSEIGTDERVECSAMAFDGMVSEFPNLAVPSYVGRMKQIVMKTIVDNGFGKKLYGVLSDISRFEGNTDEAEYYEMLCKKQCGFFD